MPPSGARSAEYPSGARVKMDQHKERKGTTLLDIYIYHTVCTIQLVAEYCYALSRVHTRARAFPIRLGAL